MASIDEIIGTLHTTNIRVSMALKSTPIPSNRDILIRADAKLESGNRVNQWVYNADTRFNDYHWHSLRGGFR